VPGAEPAREFKDVADVGAAEAVDRLVRVADRDQQPAVAGQPGEQPLLRRIGILVFVDVHRGELLPQR
jgi:hypothetical protein